MALTRSRGGDLRYDGGSLNDPLGNATVDLSTLHWFSAKGAQPGLGRALKDPPPIIPTRQVRGFASGFASAFATPRSTVRASSRRASLKRARATL